MSFREEDCSTAAFVWLDLLSNNDRAWYMPNPLIFSIALVFVTLFVHWWISLSFNFKLFKFMIVRTSCNLFYFFLKFVWASTWCRTFNPLCLYRVLVESYLSLWLYWLSLLMVRYFNLYVFFVCVICLFDCLVTVMTDQSYFTLFAAATWGFFHWWRMFFGIVYPLIACLWSPVVHSKVDWGKYL